MEMPYPHHQPSLAYTTKPRNCNINLTPNISTVKRHQKQRQTTNLVYHDETPTKPYLIIKYQSNITTHPPEAQPPSIKTNMQSPPLFSKQPLHYKQLSPHITRQHTPDQQQHKANLHACKLLNSSNHNPSPPPNLQNVSYTNYNQSLTPSNLPTHTLKVYKNTPQNHQPTRNQTKHASNVPPSLHSNTQESTHLATYIKWPHHRIHNNPTLTVIMVQYNLTQRKPDIQTL
eukprot:gene3240-2222_t